MDDKRYVFSLKRRKKDWFTWQVAMPLVFILSSYPICKWIKDIDYSFLRTFAAGDLMLFSGLLALGIMLELNTLRLTNDGLSTDEDLDDIGRYSLVLALIFFFLYALMKYEYVGEVFPDISNLNAIQIHLKVRLFSYISICGSVFSVLFCTYSMWVIVEKMLKGLEN